MKCWVGSGSIADRVEPGCECLFESVGKYCGANEEGKVFHNQHKHTHLLLLFGVLLSQQEGR